VAGKLQSSQDSGSGAHGHGQGNDLCTQRKKGRDGRGRLVFSVFDGIVTPLSNDER
jgi:hypothetical protein